MVAEVDQAERFRAERLRSEQRATPILDHGGVERRLIHLVLDEHAPVRRQGRVDLAGRFEITLERTTQVLLAGKIRAVTDPDRQRLRAEQLADANAVDVVVDRLGAHGGIGMREAAELIGKLLAGAILERVRIDRIETQPERGRARWRSAGMSSV